jgi:hypothetical protein
MDGKQVNHNSGIIIPMSMFSFNQEPVVVPVETAEETVDAVEIDYSDIAEEDYVSSEEPEFGDDV